MQLGLTIPLQRHLRKKNLLYGEEIPLRFCWDLHKIALHGRSSLLAVHCETRFAFVLFDLRAADWDALLPRFTKGLRESLLAADFPLAAVEGYLEKAGPLQCTKTHGRRAVAFLNRAWVEVLQLDYAVDQAQCQPFLEATLNRLVCGCAGSADNFPSIDRMRAALCDQVL